MVPAICRVVTAVLKGLRLMIAMYPLSSPRDSFLLRSFLKCCLMPSEFILLNISILFRSSYRSSLVCQYLKTVMQRDFLMFEKVLRETF